MIDSPGRRCPAEVTMSSHSLGFCLAADGVGVGGGGGEGAKDGFCEIHVCEQRGHKYGVNKGGRRSEQEGVCHTLA